VAIPASVARDLDEEGRALLERIAPNLNLLADLLHADVLLFARSRGQVEVLTHAQPEPMPSVYQQALTGRRLRPEQCVAVARVLHQGRPRHQVNGAVVGGVPIVREIFAVQDSRQRVVAALVTETAVMEHDRQRKRSAIFRRSMSRVRDLVVQGRLSGGENLGRLSVQDGMMVIDASGMIRYVTAVAENLYRLLGYTDSLVDAQLSELDTNEYIAFRAMETATCLEQRLAEQDRIWIKKAIPLFPSDSHRWLSRIPGRSRQPTGAIIIIQDVTDKVRREQELRVKSAMIREIHHRVKNNLQTISALLRLQARRARSPEVAEILEQTVSRILSVAVVHEYLMKDESSIINIHEVGNRILQEVTHGTLDPAKEITLSLEGVRQFLLPAQQATSCALIINELLQNAVEHGYEDRDKGSIRVRLLQTEDSMAVEIEDDGKGLPAGFDPGRGGLGLQIVRTLVKEDLKGQFQLENGRGVRAIVSFPRWRPADPPRPDPEERT
jgi:two-component system, sensor histidine kinase PdtaS